MADQLADAITIGVPADVLKDYQAFMAGRIPAEIVDYSGPHSRRDVVEVVLFQQALALGGLPAPVKFKAAPTYRRLVSELSEGNTAGAGTSMWLTDLERDKNYYISEPVIEDGDFEAGLYANPGNATAMQANTLEKIKALTAASNRYWKPDWRTLTAMGLRSLHHIQRWESMVRMVANDRADFLLAPFQQTERMLLHVDGFTLAPIHGVKVGLKGSRHFAVSQRHPQGRTIFRALQSGLEQLKRNGTIRTAYEQSGFINKQTQDWIKLQ